MSHLFESGFVVEKPAWHGLGTLLETAPKTAEEAIVAAGLDWRVKKTPLFSELSEQTSIAIPDHYSVTRKRVIEGKFHYDSLGVVGNKYTCLQNRDAFNFFDRVIETGEAEYHTAGSLKEGRTIWMLAKLGDPMQIAGNDLVEKFILLCNSHDGSSCVNMAMTPIRVVCANTLSMAMSKGNNSKKMSVRHTSSMLNRMSDMAEYLGYLNETFEETAQVYRELAAVPVVPKTLEDFFLTLVPDPKEGHNGRAASTRDKLNELYETGRGAADTDDTLWKAYNAVVEHVDYERNQNNQDARVRSAWFGQGANLKSQALNLAVKLAA